MENSLQHAAPCFKCSEPSSHSILMRKGHLPPATDSDASEKDKSKTEVISLCGLHWHELKRFLGLN
jgi:hypothetical protein